MSVLATLTPVIGTRDEAFEATKAVETAEVGEDGNESKSEYPNLEQISCIWYPITFRKKSVSMLALLDSGSEVNAIHSIFVRELGLSIRLMHIGAQKIDGTILDIFGMVVIAFSVTDKVNQVRYFEKTFLVANVSPKKVFRMLFLNLSGADIDFLDR